MAAEDQVLYFIELGGTTYRVTTVKGEEALSQTYRFDITLHVDPTDALDPDALIGSDATLMLSRASSERRIQGVVTDIKRAATRKKNAGTGQVTVVFEPRLATAKPFTVCTLRTVRARGPGVRPRELQRRLLPEALFTV